MVTKITICIFFLQQTSSKKLLSEGKSLLKLGVCPYPTVHLQVCHLNLTDNTRPHLAGGLERRRGVELGSGRPPPPARILRCRRRLSISGMEFLGDLEGGREGPWWCMNPYSMQGGHKAQCHLRICMNKARNFAETSGPG